LLFDPASSGPDGQPFSSGDVKFTFDLMQRLPVLDREGDLDVLSLGLGRRRQHRRVHAETSFHSGARVRISQPIVTCTNGRR
jgi:hypothetical protein